MDSKQHHKQHVDKLMKGIEEYRQRTAIEGNMKGVEQQSTQKTLPENTQEKAMIEKVRHVGAKEFLGADEPYKTLFAKGTSMDDKVSEIVLFIATSTPKALKAIFERVCHEIFVSTGRRFSEADLLPEQCSGEDRERAIRVLLLELYGVPHDMIEKIVPGNALEHLKQFRTDTDVLNTFRALFKERREAYLPASDKKKDIGKESKR